MSLIVESIRRIFGAVRAWMPGRPHPGRWFVRPSADKNYYERADSRHIAASGGSIVLEPIKTEQDVEPIPEITAEDFPEWYAIAMEAMEEGRGGQADPWQ